MSAQLNHSNPFQRPVDSMIPINHSVLNNLQQINRPVDQKEIPELCKLVTPGNSPEVVTFAL